MNWYWTGIVVLAVLELLAIVLGLLIEVNSRSLLQAIPFIVIGALLCLGVMKLDRSRLLASVEQKGLDTVVIDLYAEERPVKDIADSLDLTSKEVYKILRDNDIR